MIVRLVAWSLFVVALSWLPRIAAAADGYGRVTLELRPEAGPVPTHVCVLSEAQGPRTRDTIWTILEPTPELGPGGAERWKVLPEAWRGGPEDATAGQCSQDPAADCRPRVEVPAGFDRKRPLHMACATDRLMPERGHGDPRILVVFLEHLDGSPPAIASLRLSGGVVTVGVQANLAHVVVTARSVGGHYLPHAASHLEQDPTDKRIVLPLTPSCQWLDFVLPGTRLRAADRDRLGVRVHGAPLDVSRCVRDRNPEVISVLVSRAPQGRGTIDVEIQPDPDRHDAVAARFGGGWTGTWPASPFVLDSTQLRFQWQPPRCIYPANQCPRAVLADGTTCGVERRDGRCHYTCPDNFDVATAKDLPLPIEVHFEHDDPHQRWADTLGRNGQTLSGYVPPEEIRLNANINSWNTSLPGNAIRKVEVYGEDGEPHTLRVTNTVAQMHVPGASCRPLNFRPIGDRIYREAVAEVRDGTIDFGRPERAARIVSFSMIVAGGGGPAWSPSSQQSDQARIFFTGLAQFAVDFRPRRAPWSRLAPELRLGFTVGQWGLLQVDEEDTSPRTGTFRDFGWARVLFGPGLVVEAFPRIAFGAGLDLGWSFPIRRPAELGTESLNFILSPTLDVRVRIRREQPLRVSMLLQARGIFGEKQFVSNTSSTPAPTEDCTLCKSNAYSMLVLLGLELGF